MPHGRKHICKAKFDAFELDLTKGELYEDTRQRPIQQIPFQILALLLEAPGKLQTRDQLISQVWNNAPGFIDYQQSLDTAVFKIRATLLDPVSDSKYLETQSMHGYRWVGPAPSFTCGSNDGCIHGPSSEPRSTDANESTALSLPRPLTKLIGREIEINQVMGFLRAKRLVTLTGPGGAGKTRLAIRVAEELRIRFDGAAKFVDLSPLTKSTHIASAIAKAFRVSQAKSETLEEAIIRVVGTKRTLLVLDNCEHVPEASHAIVAELLAGCEALTVLATSRVPLGLDGELLYEVPPLAVPDSPTVDAESSDAPESVRLFVNRARNKNPELEFDKNDLRAIDEICQRLEGMPLAIELAAARVRVLGVGEILKHLEDSLHFLADENREYPRHQTLYGTVAWSFDLLSEEEKEFLASLSVFRGGCDLEAIQAVCAEGGDALQALELTSHLVEKSLVTVKKQSQPETRYSLLETIRQFAVDKAGERGLTERLASRHLEYFHGLVAEASASLVGSEQAAWLKLLERDHQNVLTAIDVAQVQNSAQAVRMAGGMWRFWLLRGHYALGRSVLAGVLQLDLVDADPADVAQALHGAGALAWSLADYDDARERIARAIDLLREKGDSKALASSLNGLGNIYLQLNEYEKALALYDESAVEARKGGDVRDEAAALANLMHLKNVSGREVEALVLRDRAVELGEGLKDPYVRGRLAISTAETEVFCGEYDAANATLLGLLRRGEPKDRHTMINALELCSFLALRQGSVPEAAQFLALSSGFRKRFQAPVPPPYVAIVREQEEALGEKLTEAQLGEVREWAAEQTSEVAVLCLMEYLERE